MKLEKKDSKTLLWVVGGIVAVAASAYAAKRIHGWMAWQEEREFQDTDRKIEQYDDYVHANGHKRRRWWWGRSLVTRR
ncbi:MAG: hypothetical protein QOJ65_1421 [Fimbriimonadaceae bacterium]|jgi:hypothetical protein|nr:hypothetical protein [Fimbriimonadaceae bacterium]